MKQVSFIVADCSCILLSMCSGASIRCSYNYMFIFYVFVQNTWYEKYCEIYSLFTKYIYIIYFLIISGGFTWEGILKGTLEEECPADDLPKSLSSTVNIDNIDKTVIQTAEEVQLALGSLKQVTS